MTDDHARFTDLGRLLLPLGGGDVVEAGPDWGHRPPTDLARATVWGRPPARSGRGLGPVLRNVAGREIARRRLRSVSGRVREIHELPPADVGARGPRARLRGWALAGLAVELRPPDDRRPHRLDVVLGVAGARRAGPLHAGSGGGVTVPVRTDDGDAMARAGTAGTAGDPEREVAALRRLAELERIPTLHAHGQHHDVSWCLQQRLPGQRPATVTPQLVRDVTDTLERLPRTGTRATAHEDDLRDIGSLLPDLHDQLETLRAPMGIVADDVPAVTRHGDLWRGNLLVVGGRLSGVLDWDAWAEAALPGTDLLQLLATEVRHGEGTTLAGLVARRVWLRPAIGDALRGHLRRLGAPLTDDALEAIASAWWVAEVAGTLRRRPELGADPVWRRSNVDGPLRTFAQP